MLKYKKGNLLDAFDNGEVNIVVHCANCFHTFGSGIAYEIMRRYPDAHKADLCTLYASESKLGTISDCWVGGANWIVNLYGQYGYGRNKRQVNYGAISSGLSSVVKSFGGRGNSFGFPLIGCGLAGGDWSIVSELIEFYFRDEDVTIYEL